MPPSSPILAHSSPSPALRSLLEDLVAVPEGEAREAAPRPLVEVEDESDSRKRQPTARPIARPIFFRPPPCGAPSRAGDTVTGRPPPAEALRGLLGAVMPFEKRGKGGAARGSKRRRAQIEIEKRSEDRARGTIEKCGRWSSWQPRILAKACSLLSPPRPPLSSVFPEESPLPR